MASFLLVSVEAATAPATKNGMTYKLYQTDYVWHSENYYGTIYRGYLPYNTKYEGKYFIREHFIERTYLIQYTKRLRTSPKKAMSTLEMFFRLLVYIFSLSIFGS